MNLPWSKTWELPWTSKTSHLLYLKWDRLNMWMPQVVIQYWSNLGTPRLKGLVCVSQTVNTWHIVLDNSIVLYYTVLVWLHLALCGSLQHCFDNVGSNMFVPHLKFPWYGEIDLSMVFAHKTLDAICSFFISILTSPRTGGVTYGNSLHSPQFQGRNMYKPWFQPVFSL